MHEAIDGKLTTKLIDGLSLSFNIDKELLLQFYNDAISIGLFVTDGKKYWSQRVLRNKEEFDKKRQKKSEAGKRGMQSRWGLHNTVITKDNTVITQHNKVKQSKVKKRKEIQHFSDEKKNTNTKWISYEESGPKPLKIMGEEPNKLPPGMVM
jgi:hypothetical protein